MAPVAAQLVMKIIGQIQLRQRLFHPIFYHYKFGSIKYKLVNLMTSTRVRFHRTSPMIGLKGAAVGVPADCPRWEIVSTSGHLKSISLSFVLFCFAAQTQNFDFDPNRKICYLNLGRSRLTLAFFRQCFCRGTFLTM